MGCCSARCMLILLCCLQLVRCFPLLHMMLRHKHICLHLRAAVCPFSSADAWPATYIKTCKNCKSELHFHLNSSKDVFIIKESWCVDALKPHFFNWFWQSYIETTNLRYKTITKTNLNLLNTLFPEVFDDLPFTLSLLIQISTLTLN